jgi:hypothetical protein
MPKKLMRWKVYSVKETRSAEASLCEAGAMSALRPMSEFDPAPRQHASDLSGGPPTHFQDAPARQ